MFLNGFWDLCHLIVLNFHHLHLFSLDNHLTIIIYRAPSQARFIRWDLSNPIFHTVRI